MNRHEVASVIFNLFYVAVAQIGSRASWARNYAAKDIKFGVEARALMLKGVGRPCRCCEGHYGPEGKSIWHP